MCSKSVSNCHTQLHLGFSAQLSFIQPVTYIVTLFDDIFEKVSNDAKDILEKVSDDCDNIFKKVSDELKTYLLL